MAEQPTGKANLLPFYLVVDVSYSMVEDDRIDAVNLILPKLVDALADNPILSDKVRFGVIDFSDDARVVTPLCDLLLQSSLPPFVVRGSTSFASAFRLLQSQIQSDVDQLKADGYKVYRPTVFFMSDGEPNPGDDWQQAFSELVTYDRETKVGFKYYPNFIPFGITGADPAVLQQLIHPSSGDRPMKMFLTDAGADAATAIASMAEILVVSVINSVKSVTGSGAGGESDVPPDIGDVPDLPGVSSFTADDDVFL